MTTIQAQNPFLAAYKTPYDTPPFDKIKNQYYEPAIEKGIKDHSEEINKIKLAFLLCMTDNKSRELLVKVVNCDEEYRFDRGLGCCQRRSPS